MHLEKLASANASQNELTQQLKTWSKAASHVINLIEKGCSWGLF